jgi:hypothetical protein
MFTQCSLNVHAETDPDNANDMINVQLVVPPQNDDDYINSDTHTGVHSAGALEIGERSDGTDRTKRLLFFKFNRGVSCYMVVMVASIFVSMLVPRFTSYCFFVMDMVLIAFMAMLSYIFRPHNDNPYILVNETGYNCEHHDEEQPSAYTCERHPTPRETDFSTESHQLKMFTLEDDMTENEFAMPESDIEMTENIGGGPSGSKEGRLSPSQSPNQSPNQRSDSARLKQDLSDRTHDISHKSGGTSSWEQIELQESKSAENLRTFTDSAFSRVQRRSKDI